MIIDAKNRFEISDEKRIDQLHWSIGQIVQIRLINSFSVRDIASWIQGLKEKSWDLALLPNISFWNRRKVECACMRVICTLPSLEKKVIKIQSG